MNKFWNAIKIISAILFVSVFATCIVMYWVNPSFLKRSIEYAKELLDHPLPIVGVSVGVLGFSIFQIVKNTSIGKKLYNKAQEESAKSIEKCKDLQEQAKDYYVKAENLKNDTIAVLNDFSQKYDNLTNELVKVCETSPNAKINAIGEQIKTHGIEEKAKLEEKVEQFGKDYAVKKQVEINELNEQLAELKAQFEKVVKEYENQE